MENWDDDKLKEVVEKKHGAGNKQKNKTDIVRYTFCNFVAAILGITKGCNLHIKLPLEQVSLAGFLQHLNF